MNALSYVFAKFLGKNDVSSKWCILNSCNKNTMCTVELKQALQAKVMLLVCL